MSELMEFICAGATQSKRYHFVSPPPGQPACSFGLRVGPASYAVRGRKLGNDAASLQFAGNLSFRPAHLVDSDAFINRRRPMAWLCVSLSPVVAPPLLY